MKYIVPQPWVVCALCITLSLCGHTSAVDREIERMMSEAKESGARPLRLKLEGTQKNFAQERQTSSLLKTQNEDLLSQVSRLMLELAKREEQVQHQKLELDLLHQRDSIHRAFYSTVQPYDSDEETQVPLESSRSPSPFGDDFSVVSDWEPSAFPNLKGNESETLQSKITLQ